MNMLRMHTITIQQAINAPLETVWKAWTEPEHITKWAFASDDWEASHAENDVRVGGRFKTAMATKDASAGFDFTGVYAAVVPQQSLGYTLDDGRAVTVQFTHADGKTTVVQTFEPEKTNPEEMQRGGWQAFLDNFKKHAERIQ